MMRTIRRFIERGRKGYCHEDMWSFDYWLSDLITRGLKEFKASCHTYPSQDVTWEEWQDILDEMISCFEIQNRGIDNLPAKEFLKIHEERMIQKKVALNRGLELLEKYYYDLWD